MKVHVVLIEFENPHKTRQRWTRDVFPCLEYVPGTHVVTCVDNSRNRSQMLADLFKDDYLWQGGNNLKYGASLNLSVPRHPDADYVLYVCTAHGKMLHPTWIQDLLAPMIHDPEVGQTGWLMGSNSPEGVAWAGGSGCEWVAEKYRFEDGVRQHIQGGVFAARTELMLEVHVDRMHAFRQSALCIASRREAATIQDVNADAQLKILDVYERFKNNF